MNDEKILKITEFCSHLINNKRVGSRYEGNNIEKLWKLGDLIISIYKEPEYSTLLPKLKIVHDKNGIRYDDRFYRAAIIFRRYWANEKDYLEVIKNIDVWTKLRELYPICENILKGNSKHTRDEVNDLISECKDKTYTDVRVLFIKFREKDDLFLKDLGIDLYDFRDLFIELSNELNDILEKNNIDLEKSLRQSYTSEQFYNFRLVLSALQKEEVYQNKKWNSEIKKITKHKISDSKIELVQEINNLFRTIFTIINNDKIRLEIRKSIPIVFIGNFSTYLRAIESDENKKQFNKNKELLNKFIGSMSSS